MHAIRLDMRLTDEKIEAIIRQNSKNGVCTLRFKEIASAAGCHVNTVQNAAKRLASGGRIHKIWYNGKLSIRVVDA